MLREQDSNRLQFFIIAYISQICGFRNSMSSISSMSYTARGTTTVQWTETNGTQNDGLRSSCSSKISAPKEATWSGQIPLPSVGRNRRRWQGPGVGVDSVNSRGAEDEMADVTGEPNLSHGSHGGLLSDLYRQTRNPIPLHHRNPPRAIFLPWRCHKLVTLHSSPRFAIFAASPGGWTV